MFFIDKQKPIIIFWKLQENGIEDALIKAIDYCDNVVTVEDMDSDQTLEIHGDDVDYELEEGDRIYV